jgi:hypothetical protein
MTEDSVPVPDPTKLTTDAVNAATEQWRRDLQALQQVIETRFHAIDVATSLRLETLSGEPERVAQAVRNLERLQAEKFKSIDLQFRERDIRTDQAAIASKQALDAALLAAKELVGQQNSANVEAATKAETNFTKQIDQTSVLISTLEKGLTDRISNLDGALTDRILEIKERLDRGEGAHAGGVSAKGDSRTVTTIAVGIAALFVAIIVAAVTIYAALKPS